MSDLIPQNYRDGINKGQYPYLVHFRRSKGVFGFRREYKLSFPQVCAYCGSSTILYKTEIGKPELNIYKGVGEVPYCAEHAQPIKSQKAFNKIVWIPFIITSCLVASFGLFGGFSIRGIDGLLAIFAFPVALIAFLIANKNYLRHNKNTPFNSIIDRDIVEIGSIVALSTGMMLLVVAAFLVNKYLLIPSLLLAAIGGPYLQNYIFSHTDNSRIWNYVKEEATRYMAVACVQYDIGIYTLGFLRKDYYDEFCKLNAKVIEGKDYHHIYSS